MARGSLKLIAALVLSAPAFALAACGGDGTGPGCSAAFSGNFSDSVQSNSCATLAGADGGTSGTLGIVLHSAVAGAPTNITIDLGTVAVGQFSSETVASWQATGINTRNCEFSAGSDSVPRGSFSMSLTAIGSSPHGTLAVTQYVKAPPGVACGAGDTEQIAVTF
jgi:type 1 fimbria pilin